MLSVCYIDIITNRGVWEGIMLIKAWASIASCMLQQKVVRMTVVTRRGCQTS
jgi:hypothetical protein